MVRRAYSPGVYPVRPVGPLDDSQGRTPWPLRVPSIIMDRRLSVYYRLDYDGASARLAAVFRGGGDDGFTGIDIVLDVLIICLFQDESHYTGGVDLGYLLIATRPLHPLVRCVAWGDPCCEPDAVLAFFLIGLVCTRRDDYFRDVHHVRRRWVRCRSRCGRRGRCGCWSRCRGGR